MTAQLLISELSTLVQESKRKNTDLRTAAEKSLSDLRNLPRTSEAQIAADLKSRPSFVKPFLIASSTRNPKFAGNGIVGLQRLIVSNALPNDVLSEVLDALRECSTLALDIQLKVLQALPSLLQNYADSLTGKLLVAAFQVCFLLYSSKTSVVSNTAAAALQQLVNSTFEKAASAEDLPSDDLSAANVSIGDGTISISGAVLDSYRMLEDICLLTDGQRPRSLLGASLTQNFGLELLGSILSGHADTIAAHPEQIHILRKKLMPLIIKILSDKTSFSITVRMMRVLRLVVSSLLLALAPECEIALSLLNHMLDPDAASLWKRALCLEVYKDIHAEPALVRSIYSYYDQSDEKRNIIRDHLGSLVRLAAEKPAIIGLGQQSSIPTLKQSDESSEQAALQAGGLVGSIGTTATPVETNRVGIGTQWSNPRVPCIEQLDKSDAPDLPPTYIYSLALSCITGFFDGLARFLLPFTVPSESKRKRNKSPAKDNKGIEDVDTVIEKKLPRTQSFGGRKKSVNPLSLTQHVLYPQILTSSHMVDHCWPALLAASSTYLTATLDAENYRTLIRAFQKFTQIAGLLDLATPRDAFLTTLGKHAVPALSSSSIKSQVNAREHSLRVDDLSDSDGNSSPAPSVSRNQQRRSIELAVPTINSRHLLCLRALLNLGIALGPILQRSWTIILETLQEVEMILTATGLVSQKQRKQPTDSSNKTSVTEQPYAPDDLGLEIRAVELATSRLLESTGDLPNEGFLDFVYCVSSLLHIDGISHPSADGLLSTQPGLRKHQKMRSVSSVSLETDSVNQGNIFLLGRLGDVIQSNVSRLLEPDTEASGWDLILRVLISTLSCTDARSEAPIKAAQGIGELAVTVAVSNEELTTDERDNVTYRSLEALLSGISSLGRYSLKGNKSSPSHEIDLHRLFLEALKSILEQCGDSLKDERGWNSILAIVNSIFEGPSLISQGPKQKPKRERAKSPKLIRSAFDPLQLICSDFLDSVPSACLLYLLNTLYSFCSQDLDLNISLTTAAFFRNISDHLQRGSRSITFEGFASDQHLEAEVAKWTNNDNPATSVPALWLYLLLRLTQLSIDSRIDVRHSSLHTLFRILDACSDQLSTTALRICFRVILMPMLESNETYFATVDKKGSADDDNGEKDDAGGWNKTAILEVEGISNLITQQFETWKQDEVLLEISGGLIDHLSKLVYRQTLSLSNAVFAGTSKILAEIGNSKETDETFMENVWSLWKDSNPAGHRDDSKRQNGNHDTLVSYLHYLSQILRLYQRNLSLQHNKTITQQLRICVSESNATAYTSDLDRMTVVQSMALGSLNSLPRDSQDNASEVVGSITGFVNLAYEQKNDHSATKLTFIALSKAAVSLLESFVLTTIRIPGINPTSLVTIACETLSVPVHLKYKWTLEGKGPSPWRKATMTALTLLEMSMPVIQVAQGSTEETSKFWGSVVKVTEGIIAADCKSCIRHEEIPDDQAFDIQAFDRIRQLIIPALGSTTIPDATRRQLAEYIFQNSLIHEPNPDDLARPGQELLQGLQSTHIGRVKHFDPSPRSELCYHLLDQLFDLVAVHDSSPSRIKLAQAAAPYLILRCGLVLKAYIMDQPLRGRMPQPWSEKKEMLYVLRKLVELDSEPRAIPAALGITSECKKHLHRLYPLVLRALEAAWRDGEMVEALRGVLEAVGDDFGV